MYAHSRAVWHEGMLLRPQCFQQQDRYFESLVRRSLRLLRGHAWGVTRFEIDEGALETGRLEVRAATGLMPDGTLFRVPEDADPPPARELGEAVSDRTVLLALPVERAAAIAAGGQETAAAARYDSRDIEVFDTAADSAGGQAQLRVAHLKLRLLLDDEDPSGLLAIPVLRVQTVGANRRIELDRHFIPTCLDHRVSPVLTSAVAEIEGLVHQRADFLAAIAAGKVDNTVAGIRDMLILQTLNRAEPLLAHLRHGNAAHPEDLFTLLLALAGDLATFGSEASRPPAFAEYRHHDLAFSFRPLFERLREGLREVFNPTAIEIRLEERRSGIRTASIDQTLLAEADLVFAVTGAMEAEALGRAFRHQAKAGPAERVRELVTLALPGVPLRPLPMVPKEVPPDRRALYFQLDRAGELGEEIGRSGSLGIFVPGNLPGFGLRLWAIRR